ncbi:MAG: hypothetical protein CW336_06945 [Bacteroidetes bacterium]|nr:hypothetical protein [Bacteroidota bacterium]
MKKLTAIILLLLFSLDATAQLEVKPDSFKEVAGFVNINLDIQEDDNNVPYAVVKVKTENINDKQRRELLFQGDAATFIECEYKVGEVWVYLTYKATYLKISHPDLSSTEFWFPYDMEPKKGYELTLVNNAALATDEETLERIRKLEEALRNQTEPQIVYVEKPAEQKQKPETTDKPRTPRYSFIVANASINTYGKPAFGVTLGDMRKVGVFATAMTNFRIEKMGFEGKFEHANSDQIQALIDKTGYNSKTDYMSYSVIFGVIFRAYGPINVKIGGGYSSNSMFVTLSYNNNYSSTYWVSDVSSYGFGGLIGVQAHLGNLIISLDGATTNFKIFETRLGIGFGMKGKK